MKIVASCFTKKSANMVSNVLETMFPDCKTRIESQQGVYGIYASNVDGNTFFRLTDWKLRFLHLGKTEKSTKKTYSQMKELNKETHIFGTLLRFLTRMEGKNFEKFGCYYLSKE